MSVLEDTEDSVRVRGDMQTSSTLRRRHEDVGTSANPIVLCPSPAGPGTASELPIARSMPRTSRRKCPLGAYVEIIEDSKPTRATSVHPPDVTAENTHSSQCSQPVAELTENLPSDSSQPSPSGNGNVNGNCYLSVPPSFEILMRCSICMEIFHNPANVSPCNHKFCYSCLLSWKRSNQTAVCPQCRGPIHSMQKDAQFNEVVESFLATNPSKRRSASELEALDAMEADFVGWQSRGNARTRRRGSVPQTRSRTSSDRTIRSPFVIRVSSHIRAHRAPLTTRQRSQQVIVGLEDLFNV